MLGDDYMGRAQILIERRRNIITALALVVAFLQLYAFLKPAEDVAPDEVSWLPLAFADKTCSADWYIARQAPRADPWSFHPDDEKQKRVCASEPFNLGAATYLVLQYAGNTKDRNIKLFLDAGDESQMKIPITLGNSARHGWLIHFAEIPQRARSKNAVRLVVQDDSDEKFGWLTIRRLGQSDKKLFAANDTAIFPRWLTTILTPLLVFLGLWLWSRHKGQAVIFVIAGLSILLLRFRTFYQWDEYSLLYELFVNPSSALGYTYNGHFEPVFLVVYKLGAWLARDRHYYLQIFMLAGHVAATLLLLSVLKRHGFSKALAIGFSGLFAFNSIVIDTGVWFMQFAFQAATIAILTSVYFVMLYVDSGRGAVRLIALCLISPFIATYGLLSAWVCAAYLLLFKKSSWRFSLMVIGAGLLGLIIAFVLRDDRAVGVPNVSWSMRLAFLAKGVFQGSVLALLGLRSHLHLGGALLAGLSVAMLVIYLQRSGKSLFWKSMAFGFAVLLAAYSMQAIMRADLGLHQALSFHYAYLGLVGAAFLLAAICATIHKRFTASSFVRYKYFMAAILLAGLSSLSIRHVGQFVRRAEYHEREYYEQNYQQYKLMQASIFLAKGQSGLDIPNKPMLKSSHLHFSLREFAEISFFLSRTQTPMPLNMARVGDDDSRGWLAAMGG